MKLTRARLRLAAAIAIGGGAALALMLPAGAAVSLASQSPPVQVLTLGDTASLDAKGAVLFASVTVVCPPGSQDFLNISITERIGNSIASGTTNVQGSAASCDGTPQQLTVAVVSTQQPFKKGVAFAQANLDVCGFNGCQEASDQKNIQIVK